MKDSCAFDVDPNETAVRLTRILSIRRFVDRINIADVYIYILVPLYVNNFGLIICA